LCNRQVGDVSSISTQINPNHPFTPDRDNLNNSFRPIFTTGYAVYNYHLTIFNRFGELVFESYNASHGWDGTYGILDIARSSVYIWQVEYGVNISDKIYIENGTVPLLR